MVKVLGVTINKRPKGRAHKMESYAIEKIGCVPIKFIGLSFVNKSKS